MIFLCRLPPDLLNIIDKDFYIDYYNFSRTKNGVLSREPTSHIIEFVFCFENVAKFVTT